MSMITTHILDVSKGKPANGIPVTLEYFEDGQSWRSIGQGVADADGRVKDLLSSDAELAEGVYRLTFNTGLYFAAQKKQGFYPEVIVTFVIDDATQHYHVPLLLSPFGYSTYRGS